MARLIGLASCLAKVRQKNAKAVCFTTSLRRPSCAVMCCDVQCRSCKPCKPAGGWGSSGSRPRGAGRLPETWPWCSLVQPSAALEDGWIGWSASQCSDCTICTFAFSLAIKPRHNDSGFMTGLTPDIYVTRPCTARVMEAEEWVSLDSTKNHVLR